MNANNKNISQATYLFFGILRYSHVRFYYDRVMSLLNVFERTLNAQILTTTSKRELEKIYILTF